MKASYNPLRSCPHAHRKDRRSSHRLHQRHRPGMALKAGPGRRAHHAHGFGDAATRIGPLASTTPGQYPARHASRTDADMVRSCESELGSATSYQHAGIACGADRVLPPARWDAIIAINLSSAFHAFALALPGMRSALVRMINVASVHGCCFGAESAYLSAKHGIVGLPRCSALETPPPASPSRLCRAGADAAVPEQVEQRSLAEALTRESKQPSAGREGPSLQSPTPRENWRLSVFLCRPRPEGAGVA